MAKKDAPIGQGLILNGVPKTVAIDAVRRHPQNDRKGDLTTIIESIKANKFYGRLLVQKSSGYIIAGNHRHMGLEAVGEKEIPIEEVDVDDQTALQILAVDNRSSDKASYEDEKTIELYKLIAQKNEDLTGTGMTPDELSDLIARSEEKKPAGPKRAPRPPSGDNYKEQYGVHVMCEDEDQQKRIYEALTEDGYSCRVVST